MAKKSELNIPFSLKEKFIIALDATSIIAGFTGVLSRILIHSGFEPGDVTRFSASYLGHVFPTYALGRAFGWKGGVISASANAPYEYLQHGGQLSGTGDMNDVYIGIASSALGTFSHYYEKYLEEYLEKEKRSALIQSYDKYLQEQQEKRSKI